MLRRLVPSVGLALLVVVLTSGCGSSENANQAVDLSDTPGIKDTGEVDFADTESVTNEGAADEAGPQATSPAADPAPGAAGSSEDQLASTARNDAASTGAPETAAATGQSSSSAGVQLDPALPDYRPAPGVSGTIKSVGSDTMNNLMTLWSEGFRRHYPSVRVEIEGKGSSTAPPALIGGTATFGPMSRSMKPSEIDEFESRYGYKPTQLGTAIDMLAVFVHKDNPVQSLALPQLDAMFSTTRKLGGGDDLTRWGQLGLQGAWQGAPISLYGRNSASGTYGFFKEVVLGGGDFKNGVKEQPGSSSVVQAIARDKYGIGYSGIGYQTADVRTVPLAKDTQSEPIPPTAEFAYTGQYPLARFLLVTVNYEPGSQLDPLRREFIKYIYSKQGQEAVLRDGYYPVNVTMARRALETVGIKPEF